MVRFPGEASFCGSAPPFYRILDHLQGCKSTSGDTQPSERSRKRAAESSGTGGQTESGETERSKEKPKKRRRSHRKVVDPKTDTDAGNVKVRKGYCSFISICFIKFLTSERERAKAN